MKIKKLTKEQESMLPIWRDKWIAKGLQTGDTDWTTFEKYIKVCYGKAQLKCPKIIRVQSPIVGAFAASIAGELLVSDAVDDAVYRAVYRAVGDAIGDAVRGVVRDAVYRAVGGAIGDAVDGAVDGAVRDAVYHAVADAIGDAVDGAVRDAVYRAVCDAVSDAVYRAVGDAIGDAIGGAVRDAVYRAVRGAVRDVVGGAVKWRYWFGGQFWAGGWYGSPSVVSFFQDVCGLELSQDLTERAEAYRKICESVNYIWCNQNFVMVCARPLEINLNENGQLHSLSGMSIKYPDGWGLYSINGVTVNEQIVMYPETLTIKQIQEEKNLEKQRIMVDRFGVDRYLVESGASIVDADLSSRNGARALMKDSQNQKWLACTDGSTDRVYYLAAPREAQTCKEAHEALCGFSENRIVLEG